MAESKPPKPCEMVILGIVLSFLRYLGAASLVWFVGRIGFSYLWVLVGSLVFVFWAKRKEKKSARKATSCALAANEEKAIEARVSDIPTWVRDSFESHLSTSGFISFCTFTHTFQPHIQHKRSNYLAWGRKRIVRSQKRLSSWPGESERKISHAWKAYFYKNWAIWHQQA